MGLFDIVNKATGGKAQEVVNMAVENTQATANIKNMNTGYGGGAMKANPAYAQWVARKQQLEAEYGKVSTAAQYSNSPSAQNAAQQVKRQLDALGPPPPQQIPNDVGEDVANVRATGAAHTEQLQGNANAIRNTGAEAQAAQQASGQIFEQAGRDAQGRAGPQMQVQGDARGAQAAALQQARNFVPNTSGAAGIRDAGAAGANAISAAGAGGAAAIDRFQASREGVNALQQFAKGPTGPSAAESMLRLQAARDKAAAISRARSVRGGAGAVAEAMKVAQAEGAAMAADTRGQMATVRAQEAAQIRGENLQATTSAAQLLGQNDALGLQAKTAAGNLALQGATAAGGLGVQATTAATQADLTGSGQQLQAIDQQQQGASAIRGADIDVAKANLGADLQTMGMNDEQTRFFSNLGEQARQAGIQAQAQAQATGLAADQAAAAVALQTGQQAWQMLTTEQQMQIQRMGIERGVIAANNQNAQAQTQQSMQFLGTMMMAGATVASDRRAKRDIRKAKGFAEALRKTPGSHYRYKDAKHGKGEHTGPMAQDLERTREFRSAVVERDGIKTVDTGRLTMAHHAALSDLQRQVDRLAKLGRKSKGAAA